MVLDPFFQVRYQFKSCRQDSYQYELEQLPGTPLTVIMHGWINDVFEAFVEENFGVEVMPKLLEGLPSVKKRLASSDGKWLLLEDYPDEWTFALAGGVTSAVGITTDELLERFGGFFMQRFR